VVTANNVLKEVKYKSSHIPGYVEDSIYVLCSCTEISIKDRTEYFFCDTVEIINQFIRCVNVPIFAWDLNLKILLFNGAIAQITGISQDEAIGRDISILFPEKHKGSPYDLFLGATTGDKLELMMIPVLQKSGDTRIILWNTSKLTNSTGVNLGTIAQGIDVTEQRWAKDYMNKYISELIEKNNELEQVQHQLEAINQTLDEKIRTRSRDIEELLKQKDDFITQIGHDLKTPLTPLIAILPVLRKKEQDTKRIEYLDMAIRNANHAYEILISILNMARLNKAYHPSARTLIPIYQMIEEIIINFEYEILKKRITVNNLIPKDLEMRISPIDFDTIFEKLLDNAIKYSNRDGKITISGEKTDPELLEIKVVDTGIGIIPTQKDHIFNMFYKADSSRHDGKSYGLGLSITQKIVEKNGGRIKVESEGKDMGTTFIILFPSIKDPEILGNN
ncbi:MAG: ATP-binding protein, partial [Methanobacteriota archaeon]